MQKNDLLNYLGITFVSVLIFVSGFYFGFKYSEGQDEGFTATTSDIKGVAEQVENVEVITKELEGVYWIKAGEDPTCPKDYPIKGKYDGTVGFFYTKENQFYNRVKAALCFATEDFAENSAGFLKKY